jgi:hypothetical protein
MASTKVKILVFVCLPYDEDRKEFTANAPNNYVSKISVFLGAFSKLRKTITS